MHLIPQYNTTTPTPPHPTPNKIKRPCYEFIPINNVIIIYGSVLVH